MSDVHDLEDFLASLDDPKELQHVQGIQQPHMQHNLLEFNNQLNPLALNNAPIPDLVQQHTGHIHDVSMVENTFMQVEEPAPSGGSLGSLFLSSVDEMLSSEKTTVPTLPRNVKASPTKKTKPKKNLHYTGQQTFIKKTEPSFVLNTNMMENNCADNYLDNSSVVRTQNIKSKQENFNTNENNAHLLNSSSDNFPSAKSKPIHQHGDQLTSNAFANIHQTSDSKFISGLELSPTLLMDDQSHLQYLNTGSRQDNLLDDLPQLKQNFYEHVFAFPGDVNKKTSSNLPMMSSNNVVQNPAWINEITNESYSHTSNQHFGSVYSSTVGSCTSITENYNQNKNSSVIESLSIPSHYGKVQQDGLTMNQSQILDSMTSSGKVKSTNQDAKKGFEHSLNTSQSPYMQNVYSDQSSLVSHSHSNETVLSKENLKAGSVLKSLDTADSRVNQIFSSNAYEAISPVSNYSNISSEKNNTFNSPNVLTKKSQDTSQFIQNKGPSFQIQSSMNLQFGGIEKSSPVAVQQPNFQNPSSDQQNKTIKKENPVVKGQNLSLGDDFEFDQNNEPTIRLPPTPVHTVSPKKPPTNPGAIMTINRDSYTDKSVYDSVQELALLQQKRKSLMDALESQNKLIHGGPNAMYSHPSSASMSNAVSMHKSNPLTNAVHKPKNFSGTGAEGKKSKKSDHSKTRPAPAPIVNNNLGFDTPGNGKMKEMSMSTPMPSQNTNVQDKFVPKVSKLSTFSNSSVPNSESFSNAMFANSTSKHDFTSVPQTTVTNVNDYLNFSTNSSVKNASSVLSPYSSVPRNALSADHIHNAEPPMAATLSNTVNANRVNTYESNFNKFSMTMPSAGIHPPPSTQNDQANLWKKMQENTPLSNNSMLFGKESAPDYNWQVQQQMLGSIAAPAPYNKNMADNIFFNKKGPLQSTSDNNPLKRSVFNPMGVLPSSNYPPANMYKEFSSVDISYAQPSVSLSSTTNVSLPDMSQIHLDYKGLKSNPNVALTSFSPASHVMSSRHNPGFNHFSPHTTTSSQEMLSHPVQVSKPEEVQLDYNGKSYTTPTCVGSSLCQTNPLDHSKISNVETISTAKSAMNPTFFPTSDQRPSVVHHRMTDTAKSKEIVGNVLPQHTSIVSNFNQTFSSTYTSPPVCLPNNRHNTVTTSMKSTYHHLPSYSQSITAITQQKKDYPLPSSFNRIPPSTAKGNFPNPMILSTAETPSKTELAKEVSERNKVNVPKPKFQEIKEVPTSVSSQPNDGTKNVVKNVSKPIEKKDALLKDKTYHGPKKKHILDRYQGQNTPTPKKVFHAAAGKSKEANVHPAKHNKDDKAKSELFKCSEKSNKTEKGTTESNLTATKVPQKTNIQAEKSSGIFSLFDSLLQEASQSANDSLKSIASVKPDKKTNISSLDKVDSEKTILATTTTTTSTTTTTKTATKSKSSIKPNNKNLDIHTKDTPASETTESKVSSSLPMKPDDMITLSTKATESVKTSTVTSSVNSNATTTVGALNFPFKRRHAYVASTAETKLTTHPKSTLLENLISSSVVSTIPIAKQTISEEITEVTESSEKQGLKLKITAFRSAAGNVIHQSSFLGEQPDSSDLETGLYSRKIKRQKRKKLKSKRHEVETDKVGKINSVPSSKPSLLNTAMCNASSTPLSTVSVEESMNVKPVTTKKRERAQKRTLGNTETESVKKKVRLNNPKTKPEEIRYRLNQSSQFPPTTTSPSTFIRTPGKQPFYLSTQGSLLYQNSTVPTIQLNQRSISKNISGVFTSTVQPSPKLVTVEIASPPGKTSIGSTKTVLANVRTILQTSPAISTVSGPQKIIIPKTHLSSVSVPKSGSLAPTSSSSKVTFPLQSVDKVIKKSIVIIPNSAVDKVPMSPSSKVNVPIPMKQKAAVENNVSAPRPYLSSIVTSPKSVFISPVISEKNEKEKLANSIKSTGESRFQNAFSQLISSCNPIKKYVPPSESPYFGSDTITTHSCYECGDMFLNSFSLHHHYARRSILVKVKCVQCKKNLIFFNKCEILKHARGHSEKGDVMQFNDAHLSPIPLALCQPRTKEFFLNALEEREKMESPVESHEKDKKVSRPMACTECSFSTDDPSSLENHFQNQTASDKRTCDICHLIICNPCMFSAHMRMHKHVAPYTCPECGNTFPGDAMEFNLHLRLHCLHLCRISCFKCKLCNLNFLTDDQLRNHLRTNHVQLFYKCKECPMAYKTTHNITNHQRTVHNLTPEPSNLKIIYKCPLCDTVFNDSNSHSQQLLVLHRHFHTHIDSTRVIAYKCYICKKVLEKKEMLKDHLAAEHKAPSTEKEGGDSLPVENVSPPISLSGNKMFPCAECSKIFQSPHSRSSHVRSVHRGIRMLYCCPHCPEGAIKFAKKLTLRKHLTKEHDIKDMTSDDVKVVKTFVSNCSPGKKIKTKPTTTLKQKAISGNNGNGPRVKITTRNPRLRVQNQKKKALGLPDPGSDESYGEVDEKIVEREWNVPMETEADKNEDTSDEPTTPDFSSLRFPEMYVCVKCDFQEKERLLFQNHILEHQSSNFSENSADNSAALSMVQCSECGLCFASTFTLDKHLHIKHKIHDRGLLEKYDVTLRLENNADNTQGNEMTASKNKISQLYRCKVCFRQFDLDVTLRTHMRTHGLAFVKSKHH